MQVTHSVSQETGIIQKRIGTLIIAVGIGLFIYSIVSALILYPGYTRLGEGYWDTVDRTGIFLAYLWALSFPIATILFMAGLLLRANVKTVRIITFIVSCFFALFVIINIQSSVSSPIFGIGGILIELIFILTIWNWGKERATLERNLKNIVDLRMVGYMFFALSAWFMCGLGATIAFATNPNTVQLFANSPETQANAVSILYKIITCLVLGWFFIFLSQWKSARLTKEQ